MASPSAGPAPEGETAGRTLFDQHWAEIESVLARLCGRHGLVGDDADSFRSYAHERVIDDDYRILRAYSGRSSMATFLNVAMANVYRDYRVRMWGRWRPCAAARRAGDAGVLLDTYLTRDGHPLEEAIQRVLSRADLAADEKTLRRLASEIPDRGRPRAVSLEAAAAVPAGSEADGALDRFEDQALKNRARRALTEALASLPEQDQAILRLHYWDGLTIAGVARVLGIPQKPLYRRIEASRKRLRRALEEVGIGRGDIQEILL